MQVEYEATFVDVDKDEVRARLKKAGAKLERPEFLMTRRVFNFPKGHEDGHSWARVRDEGDRITMSIKTVSGREIDDQKEILLEVDSMDKAAEFLKKLGCQEKAFQESRRELWMLDGVEITIDEWPFLEPFVEVEGKSEEAVRAVSQKIGFDYAHAFFGAVGTLYCRKYNVSEDIPNMGIPRIAFGDPNPFLENQEKK